MDVIWIQIVIFILGLAIGSFLNVCIYRIPLPEMSIYSPRRSFCPACNQSIKAYDNIPLLSYLFLGGKCRHCKAAISIIYPIVELATASLFLVMYFQFGITPEFVLATVFVAVLIPIAVIDLRHYIIPNVISLTGLILGLGIVGVIAFLNKDIDYLKIRLIGFVAGGLGLWLIAFVGSAIMRKKAMGGGDVKLMAIIGLFLGAWPELVMVMGLSALIGAIVGTLLIVTGKKDRKSPIPYGPFLAGAAVVVLLWGDTLWTYYMQFAGWN